MQTEITSDTDQSKQSLSPKCTYQHGESSEVSFCEDSTSPAGQRNSKSYRKLRPASAPRAYVTETNIWREFSLPSYCVPDYRRTPAMYIEQDIINKQRQEIQLLMEELGNRDQELTDLVMSHQKQVKAWECDNEKNRTLQAKLTFYEDELKSKEEQLKKVLVELANVNEQREVDLKELKRTQGEMIKLTERVMENSLYIKEMEAQNQKLSCSLRDFANVRQAFRAREQELVSLLKDKDFRIAERQKELDKLAEYIKILESQCRELGERNNNMTEESINWRKKYSLAKEDTERLNDDCRKKEENIQKMTQQLHESLQQAIALQKALFTSCEREKCKEEVMYSLRRQHKRTMQELQNIRELYDRLTRDTTLYHLSIKDKEFASEGKRKEEELYEEEGRRRRHLEHGDKWHHDSRRKMNMHTSFNKLKQLENNEESFLLKESKDRKSQARDNKNHVSEDDSAENNTEEEGKSGDVSTNYNRTTDRSKVHGAKDASQWLSPNITPSRLKDGPDSSKVGFTNQTPGVEAGYNKMPTVGFGNRSRNSDTRITRSPCLSPLSVSSERSQKANPVILQEVVGDVSPETADVKQFKDKSGVSSSSHTASTARHDWKCREVPTDNPLKDTNHKDMAAPPQGSNGYEPKPFRTTAGSRKDDFPKRDQEQRQFNAGDELTSVTKQQNKKKSVEFDTQEAGVTSCNRQTQAESHCVRSDSDCQLLQSHERKDAAVSMSNSACLNKSQPSRLQTDGTIVSLEREERRKNSPLKACEDSPEESKSSDKQYCQISGKYQHYESELSQEKDSRVKESENFMSNQPQTELKMTPVEMHEHHLRHEVCDQCRARGRRVCDCARTQRLCVAHSKQPTVTFAPNVSNSDKSYPCQKEPVTLTSKFSFVEIDSHLDYCSSLRESENSHYPDFSKREVSEGPLTYPPLTEFKNALSQQPNKKIHFSLPSNDSCYNQNQHHKAVCEELPDEVSAYLARQRCFTREMYYNNNNRSDSHQCDLNMAAEKYEMDQKSSSGQSVPSSGQSIPSSGQSVPSSGQSIPSSGQSQVSACDQVTCISNEKTHKNVVPNKERSIFIQDGEIQKDEQQNQDHFRNERRGKVLESGRKHMNDGPKRYGDDKNRSEDCGKRSDDAVKRFDDCRKTFDGRSKRCDDVENTWDASNNRSDDSQKRSDDSQRRCDDSQRRFDDNKRRYDDSQWRCDDSQRRFDDNKRRYDDSQWRCDDSQRRFDDIKRRSDGNNGRDNSGNNSNRKNGRLLCQDVTDADTGENTVIDSKHESSSIKKTHPVQEKRLGIRRGQFENEQASQKTQNEGKDSVGESYFCPEESEPETEVYVDRKSRPLAVDDKKVPLVRVRTAGHMVVRPDFSKSGAGLMHQKRASQCPSEVPHAVKTVLATANGGDSGVESDKSGITVSLRQGGSESSACEVKGRSGITMSARLGVLDSRSLEGRSAVTMSSTHKQSDSRSLEQECRSAVTMSSTQKQSDSRSLEQEGRSAVTMSSTHKQSDSRSLEQEGRSGIIISSTHKQLDSRSFEQESRSGFTLYSTQELSSQLDGRADVTLSANQGGSDSKSFEQKDRSGISGSSSHKPSDSRPHELDHTTSEIINDTNNQISTITSQVIVSQSDCPFLNNSSLHQMPSDDSSDTIAVRNVRQRLYNCSHNVTHSSLRNCCFSSEFSKSHDASRSDRSCVLDKDVENKNNNACVGSCSDQNCLC